MERINPTSDLGFKKVFATEEYTNILGGLIKDTFDIVAEDIKIINPYSIDVFKNAKDMNILLQILRDVSATFKTADFGAEMQVNKTTFFSERSIYYPLKRFCENYSNPEKMTFGTDGKLNRYSSLRPVYSLNILGYTHFTDDDEALRIFELYDPQRKLSFGKQFLRIGYFELTKTARLTENQQHWKDFFTTGEIKPNAPEYIKKANSIIDKANLSEEERNMADEIEKAEATIQAQMDYRFNEGMEKMLNLILSGKYTAEALSAMSIGEITALA